NTSFKVRETGKLDTALKISRNFYIPGFSDNAWLGNSSEPLYAELTSYYSKMPNMKHDRNTGDQIWWTGGTNGAQSSQTSFTLVLMTNMFNGKLTPFCLHTYDTNGQTTQNYTLSYQPTYHWTFQVYYMKFNKSGILKYQNQVGMLWRYSFF
ncbi:MAG: hypothetical protein JW832_08195, partial [Deltaproteobacteria bacterium]|nr:hypothetical protein [Deltaproteobacteria bacterium]